MSLYSESLTLIIILTKWKYRVRSYYLIDLGAMTSHNSRFCVPYTERVRTIVTREVRANCHLHKCSTFVHLRKCSLPYFACASTGQICILTCKQFRKVRRKPELLFLHSFLMSQHVNYSTISQILSLSGHRCTLIILIFLLIQLNFWTLFWMSWQITRYDYILQTILCKFQFTCLDFLARTN